MPQQWDPDVVKQALDMELSVHEDRGHRDVAKRKIADSAARAADRLIHLALYGDNENLAAKCAMYLLDRNFGKVTDAPMTGKGDETLESIVKALHEPASTGAKAEGSD